MNPNTKSNKQSKKEKAVIEPVYKSINKYVQYSIIALFVFVLYGNTISHEYALDDYMVIADNSFTQKGIAGIHDIFAYDSFMGMGIKYVNSVEGGRYRPISIATFAIEKQLFGQKPHISHFINLCFYALMCILLFKLLSKLFDSYPKSHWFNTIPFIATLLFVAHPIHTEVVANIKCRDEIFALLFSLISLWYDIKYLGNKKILNLIVSAISFAIALFSKEIAVVFIVIIPATIYYFTSHSLKKIAISSIPLFAMVLLFLFVRHQVIAKTHLDNTNYQNILNYSFHDMNASQKWATIVYCLGMYVKLMLFPHPLTWDYYPYHIPKMEWSQIMVIVSLLIYIGLFYVMFKGLKSKSIISFSILIFLVPLGLTANIFFPIGAFMCERFLFISSIGFAIVLAWILTQYFPKINLKALWVLCPILCLYSFKTIDRNKAWKDGFTLIETDLKTSQNSVMSLGQYANNLYNKAIKETDIEEQHRLYDEILKYGIRADSICHDNQRTNFILGTVFGRYKNDYPRAISHLRKSIEIDPSFVEAYHNLGISYAMSNQFDKAIAISLDGLKIDPNNIEIYKTLSTLYYNLGQQDKVLYYVNKVKELEVK